MTNASKSPAQIERERVRASLMEQRFLKKEKARQNKLERAKRSAAAKERAYLNEDRERRLGLVKELRENAPYELVEVAKRLLATAKARLEVAANEETSAHSLAHPDDPDSVQAWEGAKTAAQKAHKEYESLRVSLAYRKRQLAKFVVESEERKTLLRAELNRLSQHPERNPQESTKSDEDQQTV